MFAVQAAALVTASMSAPLELKFERVMAPFLLLHVNRYAGRAVETEEDAARIATHGSLLVRWGSSAGPGSGSRDLAGDRLPAANLLAPCRSSSSSGTKGARVHYKPRHSRMVDVEADGWEGRHTRNEFVAKEILQL
jgi:hypothetical protein